MYRIDDMTQPTRLVELPVTLASSYDIHLRSIEFIVASMGFAMLPEDPPNETAINESSSGSTSISASRCTTSGNLLKFELFNF